MSVLLAPPLTTWLLQAATLPDTIVTKQIAVRSWWQTLIDIEQAIVPLALLLLLIAIAFGVYKAGQAIQRVSELIKASSGDVTNAAHSVRNVAEDLRYITGAVRTDIEAVGDTVRTVNERVRDAVEAAEERVRRFDALVDVAQEEVEEFVISTAATLRGIRRGGSVLRRSFLFARRNGLFRARRKRRWRDREERDAGQDGLEHPRIRERVPDES